MSLSIEAALKTAIDFEKRIKEIYKEASKQAQDPVGRRVFAALAEEEQGHLDYLRSRLREWQNTGRITPEKLGTAIPPKKVIEREMEAIKEQVHSHDFDKSKNTELKMLNSALEVEIETSDFYKRMVEELPREGQALFKRFVEIEDGHQAIVQAEIDYISGPGYWFDFREFDLSGGA